MVTDRAYALVQPVNSCSIEVYFGIEKLVKVSIVFHITHFEQQVGDGVAQLLVDERACGAAQGGPEDAALVGVGEPGAEEGARSPRDRRTPSGTGDRGVGAGVMPFLCPLQRRGVCGACRRRRVRGVGLAAHLPAQERVAKQPPRAPPSRACQPTRACGSVPPLQH